MVEICKKSKCIGCLNCKNICKNNAIDIEKDEFGFIYPVVNSNCKNCGLCKRKCPIINGKNNIPLNICYACKNNNEKLRRMSSSGGVFYLLALEQLKSGIVYGANYNESLKHIKIKKQADLKKILGSKYIQSNLSDTFEEIKEELKNGIKVLFCSTPCQVAALKIYLEKEYDNLFTIDFICHGVGSSEILNIHLQDILKSTDSHKIKKINFRDKTTGWNNFSFSAETDKTTYIKPHNEDNYMKTFLYNLCLRESCYQCQYKTKNRYSDITLADFWGINDVIENFDDNLGVSAVILNTDKGIEHFESIRKKLSIHQVKYSQIEENNIGLSNPSLYNKCREEFIKNIKKNNTLERMNEKFFRRENAEKYNK